jgi:hypothetical protein
LDRAFFQETEGTERYLFPSVNSSVDPDFRNYFEFFGAIVGKALYDDILLKCPLAPFFLNAIVGKSNQIDELNSLDSQVYENLMMLKQYPRDEVEDLCLTMSIANDVFGVQETIQLIPNGAEVDVTADNRLIYIANFADYMLNKRTAA